MAYSTAIFQAAAILLYIHFKTEDEMYDFLSARNISESLQYELSPFRIRVKIIEPGVIRTDFFGRSMVLPKTAKPAIPEVWPDCGPSGPSLRALDRKMRKS